MAGFIAATVVDQLKYDLSTKANPDAPKGVIKEPSDTQIDEFQRAMIAEQQRVRRLLPDLPPDLDLTSDKGLKAVEEAENAQVSDEVVSTYRTHAEIFAALCSGVPSAEELMTVPRRIRTPFFRWVKEQVTDPEAAAADGN